ncbi:MULTISPECIES: exodeoxyribonuclease VII small subunit [unclassified Gemella]|uniref:exodeoxyribonuclease VII small subunit n=1 Tax=unclassified Gemella TaxID=2624949 RepID=UPI001C05B21A|nr:MULTISPECIES: exodeoxyribonuclease VII small subunit [unclassified Gemella]MBU0278271.1 exodeoxyribonuclease VII small subunit [Gemella sp. zg-1178]QWQ38222.1 exodeoxyribonuclease VII small subunit [Gemella sp. zg-570]
MEKKNFEEQLLDLENIVRKLESNELTLDDALEQYKAGIDIIKSCNNIIKKAEKKVLSLKKELDNEE